MHITLVHCSNLERKQHVHVCVSGKKHGIYYNSDHRSMLCCWSSQSCRSGMFRFCIYGY